MSVLTRKMAFTCRRSVDESQFGIGLDTTLRLPFVKWRRGQDSNLQALAGGGFQDRCITNYATPPKLAFCNIPYAGGAVQSGDFKAKAVPCSQPDSSRCQPHSSAPARNPVCKCPSLNLSGKVCAPSQRSL